MGSERAAERFVFWMRQILRAAGFILERDEEAVRETIVKADRADVLARLIILNRIDFLRQLAECRDDFSNVGRTGVVLKLEEHGMSQHLVLILRIVGAANG